MTYKQALLLKRASQQKRDIKVIQTIKPKAKNIRFHITRRGKRVYKYDHPQSSQQQISLWNNKGNKDGGTTK